MNPLPLHPDFVTGCSHQQVNDHCALQVTSLDEHGMGDGTVATLSRLMLEAAESLDFEKAARLRDELRRLEGSSKDSPKTDTLYDPYDRSQKKVKRAAATHVTPARPSGGRPKSDRGRKG